MTQPKPTHFRAKIGRKSRRFKNHQDKLLKMFFDSDDISPWQASLYTKCGYDYALKKYFDFFGHLIPSEIVLRALFHKKIGYTAKF